MFLFVKTLDFLVGMWYGYFVGKPNFYLPVRLPRLTEKWIDKTY